MSFGPQVIYDSADFNLSPRDKVGIIGPNGAGKTTLFRVLIGDIKLDSGVIKTDGMRIGYLPQTIDISAQNDTVWDFLMSGRPIGQLEQNLNAAYEKLAENPDDNTVATQISHIQSELEYYDYYNHENQLLELIENMNIGDDMLDMPVKNLSGGQKSRVAFARTLYSMPEILLLDEPTNHLDMQSREFVTQYIKKYRGSVLIISHDRDFLNKTVNKILYLDKVTHKISVFDGNYDEYKRRSAALKQARAAKIESQTRQIEHLAAFVQRAAAASPTNHALKQAGHTRARQLEKIMANRISREQTYKQLKMNLAPRRATPKTPIMVDNLWFRFPGARLLYRNMSFHITGGERFLIAGPNGAGKSTLLKLIIGQLKPERGTIDINSKTDIAYYAQEMEQLNPDKNVIENVDNGEYTDQQLRAILANFLFTDRDITKRVSVLSPGECARIALCRMLLRRANMLILDEPTNHLDPETQKIIGDNFRDYDGTIIVVSHNPEFVEQIGITRMLTLPDGRIDDYDHDKIEQYFLINTKQ